MPIVAWIELVCVVFTVILVVGQYVDNENTNSLKWVKIFLFVTIFWLLVDSLSLICETLEAPSWILWILNFATFVMRPVCLLVLAIFANKFVIEKGKCSKWWFTTPQYVSIFGIVITIVYFIIRTATNPSYSFNEPTPTVTVFAYIVFIIYADIVAFYLHKRIGLKAAIIVAISFVPMVSAIIVLYLTGLDYSIVAVSIFAALVCGSVQRENIRSKARGNVIAENNDRILALHDNFEMLYDVDLDTLNYEQYVKGKTSSQNITNRLVNNSNFFEDCYFNVEKVGYPDDIEKFRKTMTLENITTELKKQDHIDLTYRIISDNNPVWMRMRVVYKNSDKSHIIVGVFNAEEMMQRKANEEKIRRQLIENMVGNDAVFIIDTENDTRTTLHNNTPRKDNYLDKEKYSTGVARYIQECVARYDVKKVKEMTAIPYMVKTLAEVPEYSFTYRDLSTGRQRFYEMRLYRFDENQVLMSITEKDQEILTGLIVDYLKGDYFAMYAIDVDEGYAHIIKDDPAVLKIKKGDVVLYEDLMKEIAERFGDDSPERDYFSKMGNANYLKQKFANQDKSSFVFNLTASSGEKWATTKEMVLSRKASTNEPSLVAICFSFLDAEARDNAILQQKLEEDMTIIGGLAEEYQMLFFANIDEGIVKVASADEEYKPVVDEFMNGSVKGIDGLKIFSESPFVHPDDRALFKDFGGNFVREKLKNAKKFMIRFRSKTGNTYSWFEMDVLKNEAINERANCVIIGFAECLEEIKKEQLLQQAFDLMNKDASSDQSILKLLALIAEYYGARRSCVCEIIKKKEFVNIAYEWDAEGVTEESLQHVEIPINEFKPLLDVLSDGQVVVANEEKIEDKAIPLVSIFKDNGFKQVVLAPIISGGELVGFIGLDVPDRTIKDLDSAKTVATIIYSEILKRKETDEEHITLEKVTNSFATVYFVDLSRDYAHNWKLDKEYRYTDEDATISKFSESFSGYIKYCIDPKEQERCYRQTSPEYILEQFKTKSIFSVNMKDVSKGKPTFLAFDFIKVTDDGNQFVVCSRDITDVLAKENEQKKKLQEALELADAANKAKTTFLFNMSHDIRTPMNAIIGFTSMAMKNIDNKERTLDCLQKTQQSGNMLVSLINNVLEVSRIESGHAKVEEKPVDVLNSFASISDTMQELARAKQIDLKFVFGKLENRFVYCDLVRCIRIFVNIISNAIKYTPNGGKVVATCEQIQSDKEGYGRYRYTVEDNGIGMSEEFQKHIFEQFTREANTTLSGVEGTGLGMTVVKSFVDLLGGTISFKSKKDVGTTFYIELPFKLQQGTAEYLDPITQQIVSATEKEEHHDKVDFKGKKVLLVEDNMLNAEITTEILQDEGFVVEHANDGSVAVEFIKEKGPSYYDVVLMDIQMPRMNGYEATKAIREMHPDANIPIIALSANAFQEDKDQSIAAGMNDHVAKPIDIKQLLIIVAKYIK